MTNDLAQDAVNAALKANWQEAVRINLSILKINKSDVESLNRLARAYAELGNIVKAKQTAQKVLDIDPFNPIAKRSLDKWKQLKKGETYSPSPGKVQSFLEEPGKTKICSLLFLGSNKTLAKLDSGDPLKFDMHSHRVSVLTHDNKYIGRLPDDLSARLKKLTSLGNSYDLFVKSTDKSEVKVFIKEVKRNKKIADIPSFSSEKFDYITFTPPELVHDKAEMEVGNEEED